MHHNSTALAICETFARQANFEWASSLALGGGEMIGGVSLAQKGGQTIHIRKSLELAAETLAQGQAIQKTTQDLLAKPVIPNWMYRLLGGFGWKRQAKSNRAEKSLKRRPYSEQTG